MSRGHKQWTANRSRLLGRARHLDCDSLAAEKFDAEVIAVTLDLGQGRELARHSRTRAGRRRRPRARRRRSRRVRARVHPAGAAGRRDLRRSVSAGDRARPSAHRAGAWSRSREWKARGPSRTGAPAWTTIRCVSSLDSRARSVALRDRRGAGLDHDARREGGVRPARRRGGAGPADSPYSIDTNLWGRAIAPAGSKTHGSSRPRTSTR